MVIGEVEINKEIRIVKIETLAVGHDAGRFCIIIHGFEYKVLWPRSPQIAKSNTQR
jgi:hypothetical protein